MGISKVQAWTPRPRRFSARYGARHPWLVPWPRAGLYLLWRVLISGVRPVLFLALVAVSGLAAVLAARELPPPANPALPLDVALDAALYGAVPDQTDRHGYWLMRLDQALQVRQRSIPDIAEARSFAHAYIAIRGEEALAIELMGSQGRNRRQIEADLRSMPTWERQAQLRVTVEALAEDGERRGFEPPFLLVAPAQIQTRLRRNERLYGPTLREAETWFVDPAGRALALDSLPGLDAPARRVYGDVRGLLVQGCALALERTQAVGQCRVGFLPKPDADPVLAGLALAVPGTEPEFRAGARVAKAAWAAGHMDAQLAELLALGNDAVLGEAAVLASTMRLMVDAGEVWSQPDRFDQVARMASLEAARAAEVDHQWRSEMFAAFSALRREVGALAALRLMDTVRSLEDAQLLVRLAQNAEGQLLALHAMTGPDMLLSIEAGSIAQRRTLPVSRWPRQAQRYAAASTGAGVLALGLLAFSLYGGFRRRRRGVPGALEQADATMSRLILGRNS